MVKVNVAIKEEYLLSIFPVANITTQLPNGEVVETKRRFWSKRGFNSFKNELKQNVYCEVVS